MAFIQLKDDRKIRRLRDGIKRRRRLRDVVEWWNERVPHMEALIAQSSDPDIERFKWGRLVWQEIEFCIQMDSEMDKPGLDWLCRRRGFSNAQCTILLAALEHIGLWNEEASLDAAVENLERTQRNHERTVRG